MTNNLTLLYVEDDEIIRENFSEIFRSYFNTVLTTDNGNEALEIYNTNHIDVAILDISIPGINGLNLAQEITRDNEEIIVLMISAYSDKDKLLQAVNIRLFGYLVKPVNHQDLSQTLEKIIQIAPKNHLLSLSNSFTYDTNTQTLRYNKQTTKLTKNEKKVLQLLIKQKNEFVSACQIHQELFPNQEDSSCNNVVQLISRLKKKILNLYELEDYFIENCYGVGYKIKRT